MTGATTRRLIVNADDFGRSPGVNAGIARGHERGIVTSASLMVRWPAAEVAGAYARAHPSLSVGLHLDLCEWAVRDGEWQLVYDVLGDRGPAAVRDEVDRQLSAFERLVGRPPTHLDSHQHIHREEPVRSAVLLAAERLGIPVRDCTPGIGYLGGFYGQYGRGERYPEGISRAHLVELIDGLAPGITELGCHPATEPERDSTYAQERPMELSVLCDPAVAAALAERRIELWSFAGPLREEHR